MRLLPTKVMPILQALWRHKWLGVATAWLVCTVGWIGVALIPAKYEASARVYLNADPLLTPLLKGLAADTDPTRQLDFMQRTLLSRPNLEQLVCLTDLDIGITTPEEKEALFKRLAADISVAPVTLNLLTLSYRDRDPVTAKNVVQSLLTIFAEKVAGSSRAEMDNAQRFLDSEIASYRDQLRAVEKRRAELAQQYPDIVSNRPPDAGAPGDESISRLDQARTAVTRLKLDLADAVTKRDALQKELAAVPAMLSVDRAPQVVVNAGRLAPLDERLQELRHKLDDLRLKYTEDHPDVKAARNEIAQLQAEGARSSSATGKAGGAAAKGRSPTRSMSRSRSGWSMPRPLWLLCSDASTKRKQIRRGPKALRNRRPVCWCKRRTWIGIIWFSRRITKSWWRGGRPLRLPMPPTPRPRRSSSVLSIRPKCPSFRQRRTG